jgi:hypothetical protein
MRTLMYFCSVTTFNSFEGLEVQRTLLRLFITGPQNERGKLSWFSAQPAALPLVRC